MNTGGKNVGDKPTERRKQAIDDVVTNIGQIFIVEVGKVTD